MCRNIETLLTLEQKLTLQVHVPVARVAMEGNMFLLSF